MPKPKQRHGDQASHPPTVFAGTVRTSPKQMPGTAPLTRIDGRGKNHVILPKKAACQLVVLGHILQLSILYVQPLLGKRHEPS